MENKDRNAKKPPQRKAVNGQRPGPTGPLPRPVADIPDETTHVSKESPWRKTLLVLLPIIVIILAGVLGYLIVKMPESAEVKLQPMRETPPSTDILLQTTAPTNAFTAPALDLQETKRFEPVKIQSERVSSLKISRLIQSGAGVRPGENTGAPELKFKQGDTVPTWPGIKAAKVEETTLPTVAQEITLPVETMLMETTFAAEASEFVEETTIETAIEETSPEETLPEETTPAETEPAEKEPAETEPAETEPDESEDIEEDPVLPLDNVPDEPAEADYPVDEIILPGNIPAGPLAIEYIYSHGFAPSGMTAYAYGNIVNVRSDSDMNSEIIAEVFAGEIVEELATNGSWSLVRMSNGMEGFIYSNLLSYNYVAPEEEEIWIPDEEIVHIDDVVPYLGTLYATNSNVNIRSGPNLNSEIIGTMYYGDWCTAIGYTGGWFQIEWYNGEVAYVHGDYLQEEAVDEEELTGEVIHEEVAVINVPQMPADQNMVAGGSAVVNMAFQYVGSPYVFGASGPNAFDCSGFTSFIFSSLGAPISRTTYTQVNDGIPVPFSYRDYSNMIPGDLLLFAEGTDVFHAGIYIGGGQMIHAGNPSTGVVVDDLNLDFYATRLAYVRRIIY